MKAPKGGQVSVRFNLAAREAVEKAIRERSPEKAAPASDNLRWSLGSTAVSADQKPLGKAAKTPPAPTAAASAAVAGVGQP